MGKKVTFGAKPKKAKNVPEAADEWVSGGESKKERDEPKQAEQVPMKRLTIDVPTVLHQRVKIGCAKRGLKMADEIRKLLEKEFPE